MPEINPEIFTSLRRGAVGFGRSLRPLVRPLGYGVAIVGGALALGYAGREVTDAFTGLENAKNPPLQVEGFDANPATPGDEGAALFDRKTGRLLVYAPNPAVDKVGPERSQEREITTALWVAGAVAVGIVALVMLKK